MTPRQESEDDLVYSVRLTYDPLLYLSTQGGRLGDQTANLIVHYRRHTDSSSR
jgi:hypothetical protein